MEILGGAGIALGGLLSFIGWVWLVVLGFKEGGPLWGILNFLFSPLAAIIFCFVKKTGWIPLALMIIGVFITSIGMVPFILQGMEGAM